MILRFSILDNGGQELGFAQSKLDMDVLPDDPTALIAELSRQIAASPALPAIQQSIERRKKAAADLVSSKMTHGQS